MNLNKRHLWICHDPKFLQMTNLKYLGLLREKNYKLFVEIVKKRILNNLNNKPKIKDFCQSGKPKKIVSLKNKYYIKKKLINSVTSP